MTTDTSEKALETLIVRHMTGGDGLDVAANLAGEPRLTPGGTGWFAGSPRSYDRAHALDTSQLFAFLHATQPAEFAKLGFAPLGGDTHDINRLKFLSRLSAEVGKRVAENALLAAEVLRTVPVDQPDLFATAQGAGSLKSPRPQHSGTNGQALGTGARAPVAGPGEGGGHA